MVGYRPGGVESPLYQRVACVLSNEALEIRWGRCAAARASAALPVMTTFTPCNDTNVICSDHTVQPGI